MHNRKEMGRQNRIAVSQALGQHGFEASFETCLPTIRKALGHPISQQTFYRWRQDIVANPPAEPVVARRVASPIPEPQSYTTAELLLVLEVDRLATRVGITKLKDIFAAVESRHVMDRV